MSERNILEQSIADHQQAIDNARAELKKLERIRVPDGIEFRTGRGRYGRGLMFNSGRQELCYGIDDKVWFVGAPNENYTTIDTPLYLEPCKREDLKPSDWAYVTDASVALSTDTRSQYVLVLDDKKHVFTTGGDIEVRHTHWMHWYKVTE